MNRRSGEKESVLQRKPQVVWCFWGLKMWKRLGAMGAGTGRSQLRFTFLICRWSEQPKGPQVTAGDRELMTHTHQGCPHLCSVDTCLPDVVGFRPEPSSPAHLVCACQHPHAGDPHPHLVDPHPLPQAGAHPRHLPWQMCVCMCSHVCLWNKSLQYTLQTVNNDFL